METIVLARLHDSFHATLLKDMLLNEGIESTIRDDTLTTVYTGLLGYKIELSVFEKDYERAKEIYESGFPQEVT